MNTDELQEVLNRTYNYTVLVVEDDLDIQSYLQAELKQNFRVLVADNGVKALEVLMNEEISMVISDVMMPEMNGFDLCRKIKSDIVLSHLPVMLLTALSDDKQQMYGAASGADAYIQKPFNIEVVKLRIIKLLEDRVRLREAYRDIPVIFGGCDIQCKTRQSLRFVISSRCFFACCFREGGKSGKHGRSFYESFLETDRRVLCRSGFQY